MPLVTLLSKRLTACGLGLLLLGQSAELAAQQRWFQVEVSVFSNESPVDRNEETWLADNLELGYPSQIRRLNTLLDRLLFPRLWRDSEVEPGQTSPATGAKQEVTPQAQRLATIRATGPFPPREGVAFEFFDPARDALLQLPLAESDFRQTNSALERSAEHRLLFHGLWRQPMPAAGNATAILVQGGQSYGGHHELEGSLALSYNNQRDRIVVDASLWLSEFSINPDPEQNWQLPALPESLIVAQSGDEPDQAAVPYYPSRIYQLQQQREMRSTEFHYLDHPALGLVITVEPYEVPPLAADTPD